MKKIELTSEEYCLVIEALGDAASTAHTRAWRCSDTKESSKYKQHGDKYEALFKKIIEEFHRED